MYYIALIIIAIIFIWRITAGFRKGMIQEIISLIAMVIAGVCVILILGAAGSYLNQEIGKTIQMVAVLAVVCLIYRLDKLLGAVVGLAEAVLIVGFLVYFLKNWGLSILAQQMWIEKTHL